MSEHIQRLLQANAQWAHDFTKLDPDFFKNSAKHHQTPHTLWIGCADSRVPESVITKARPGDIFVHRNIANQLHLDDHNILSVIKYAVDSLGVENVIIVGHTECGGAAACLGAAQSKNLNLNAPIATIPTLPADSPLNRWLEPLTRITAGLKLSSVPPEKALTLVVEANVKAQVENLAKTTTIADGWKKGTGKGQDVWIHGWVYDLSSGLLRDLNISRGPPNAAKKGSTCPTIPATDKGH